MSNILVPNRYRKLGIAWDYDIERVSIWVEVFGLTLVNLVLAIAGV